MYTKTELYFNKISNTPVSDILLSINAHLFACVTSFISSASATEKMICAVFFARLVVYGHFGEHTCHLSETM
jgi:hypothetical protein